jgi:hypothetical protein
MDVEPITEDDLDDLWTTDSSGDCLVCLTPCKSWSNELFLYTCHCIYRIHPTCYKEWRSSTQTNRICIICKEEFDTFVYEEEESEQEQEPEPDRHIFIRQEGPAPITCCEHTKNICISICFVLLLIYAIIGFHTLNRVFMRASQ